MRHATVNGTAHPPKETLPGHHGYVNISEEDHRLYDHPTQKAAIEEAARIARKINKSVIVYAPVCVINPPAEPPCTMSVPNSNAFNTIDLPY